MNRPHDALPCEEALDLLEPYLDGDLPPDEADRVRRHLDGCPACAEELALAAQIQRELRALPQPDCPPEVIERVRRAGRGGVVPFPSRERAPRWRIAAAAALTALAVGGGWLGVHIQHERQQREQVAQATREARLALAYFGKVTRKAGLDVRDEVLEKRLVVPVARSVSRSLGNAEDAESRKEL
ncbi:MAG TPA: zf-HC2 domain-containing protein [Thermoanaerobaculia bacterium]